MNKLFVESGTSPPPHPNLLDLTGQPFGRLTVTSRGPNGKHGEVRWHCRCTCGNETLVYAGNLRSGDTRSCGCLSRELLVTRSTTHGAARVGAETPEYHAWHAMFQRCTNPHHASWEDYGGRGVTVCERWQSFENFIADMGPRPSPKHSLDRTNNDGNYEPSNCRWATWNEQARNRRSADLRGEQIVTAKLNEAQVHQIVAMLASGQYQRTIAKLFSVTSSNISAIARGKSWSSVTGIIRDVKVAS